MPKLKRGPSDTAQYKAYNAQNRFEKNKIKKLTRLAALQPNNEQIQKALEKVNFNYKRNRKSAGQKCKGLYKILGFEKNQMNDSMKKSTLGLHWYAGIELQILNTPTHSRSMCEQLEELGFKKLKVKYGKRKYKKTTR